MSFQVPIKLNTDSSLSISGMAEHFHRSNPDVPVKTIKKKLRHCRHNALSYYKIPRSVNGNKLGLKKREIEAKKFEVK